MSRLAIALLVLVACDGARVSSLAAGGSSGAGGVAGSSAGSSGAGGVAGSSAGSSGAGGREGPMCVVTDEPRQARLADGSIGWLCSSGGAYVWDCWTRIAAPNGSQVVWCANPDDFPTTRADLE